MAPKSFAPGLTAEERESLNQLLAKAQQSGESVVSSGVDGYGSYVAGSAPAPSMLSPSDPVIAPTGTPLFTPDGISYSGGNAGGFHRNRKSASAIVGDGGAMTDACKRRCDEGFEFVEGSMDDIDALIAERETLDSIAEFNRDTNTHLPVGHHGARYQYPFGLRSCLNAAVPLPVDTTDSAWDDTLCELPAVAKMQMSYRGLRDLARSGDTRIRSYLNYICSSFGEEGIQQIMLAGSCKSGGFDLGAWLKRNGWDIAETNTASTFRRTSATAAKAKAKGSGKGA